MQKQAMHIAIQFLSGLKAHSLKIYSKACLSTKHVWVLDLRGVENAWKLISFRNLRWGKL